MCTTSLATADELLTIPTGMGWRYELIAGRIQVYSASGWRRGQIVGNITAILSHFIKTHELGRGFAAGTGFLLTRNPDAVRAPDFAFISNKHLPKENPTEAFWPGAPDLAVEVLSPGARTGEVDEKIEACLAAGCQAVWVIDPELETVTIYRSRSDVVVKAANDILAGDPVVPGFSCPVAELFR